MSSISVPKVRIEIFRETQLFDDHFLRIWEGAPSDGVVWDGDIVQLTVQAGQTTQNLNRPFEVSTIFYPYFNYRLTSGLLSAKAWIRRKDTSAWLSLGTLSLGVNSIDMRNTYDGTIDYIVLQAFGSPGAEAWFDYVAISKYAYHSIDTQYLAKELTINRPVLSKGVNGALVWLNNAANTYSALFKPQDAIIIWVARDSTNLGHPEYKRFGGRIIQRSYVERESRKWYVKLECMGHARELTIVPCANSDKPLIKKVYSAVNGRTIIEEAISKCNYVYKHPTASKWFDNTGSSGSTDDRINSTHDITYDDELPIDVIKDVLDKASNPSSVQGFDIIETPSGALIGHLRSSADFDCGIGSLYPFTIDFGDDINSSRNKVTVYGSLAFQDNKDAWVHSNTNWSAIKGTLYSPNPGYILCDVDVNREAQFKRTVFPHPYLCGDKILEPSAIEKLYCQILLSAAGSGSNQFDVILEAPDSSNYFAHEHTNIAYGVNLEQDLDLGEAYTGTGKTWKRYGSAAWDNIKFVRFNSWIQFGTLAALYATVDYLTLTPLKFRGDAEDTTSQGTYGILKGKPIVDDALKSDAECLSRAASLIASNKNPLEQASGITLDGDYRFHPSYTQRLQTLTGIDITRRIVEVTDRVKQNQWDSELELSNEPVLWDYVFRDIEKKRKLLERRTP